MNLRPLWDKLGEYLAVYVIATIAALILRSLILWVRGKLDR